MDVLASPVLALAITVVGVFLFWALGKDPVKGLQAFFVEPLKNAYALSELSVKAVPLVLIGLGLAVCFRSNVWNIGAEGQFVLGALAGGWVAMQAGPDTSAGSCAHPAGRRAGRHGLGGIAPAARPLQRQRDPGQPDAGLRGGGAGLAGLRPLEGPGRLQLPADQDLCRSPDPG
jgi:hypothetical protein